jgi:HAD superfamily hydrolase (TIGR01458 family)
VLDGAGAGLGRSAARTRGVLLDIDGVLVVSGEPIAGAVETLAWLREREVPFHLVTNSSSQSRRGIAATLSAAGMPIGAEDVMTAVGATAAFLRSHYQGAKVCLLSDRASAEDLEGVEVDDEGEVVVVGGASDLFSYERVNGAFKLIMGGAPLVAMHRSLYWKTSEGFELDGGAYTRALEEAAGVEAQVCGKPAKRFFTAAAEAVGLPLESLVMIGDDVVGDVMAAQNAGAAGVLVRTGKFTARDLQRGSPDHVIDSIGELRALLES